MLEPHVRGVQSRNDSRAGHSCHAGDVGPERDLVLDAVFHCARRGLQSAE